MQRCFQILYTSNNYNPFFGDFTFENFNRKLQNVDSKILCSFWLVLSLKAELGLQDLYMYFHQM